MTIDHNAEQLLTFSEAAERLPKHDDGRACHPNTISRWAREGLDGIVLESIQIGRRRFTSVEACQRFFEALTRVAETRQ